MKVKNWTLVEESRPSTMLPAGGYVCRITGVEDVPSKEYLWVVYDVLEGEYAGTYAGLPASDDWKHRFTRSYKDTAEGMFKAFLMRLEESNRQFKVDDWQQRSDEKELIGLEVGLVFGEEKYTKNNGDDGERTVVSYVVAAQDVRNGDFKVPAPKDRREGADASPTAAGAVYEDVPF